MWRFRSVLVALLALLVAGPVAAAPEGQMTWAIHVALAPTWFDPAETTGMATPFMVLYAIHDALVKPMPGNTRAPSLAAFWKVSNDGLTYEFQIRDGIRFHNGDPLTADDVKFSFERYRGASSKLLKEKVASVEITDPLRVLFRLKEPWPDFLTYYGSLTTGAGWVVPKRYIEKVGEEGFKKAPVGAGPYRFVSFTPGVELVLEANEQYYRKVPSVKRLVFKVVPDEATRLAMLKRGEADIVYLLQGELAEEARRTPDVTLKPTPIVSTHWLSFVDQWDPKSPWADRRVRLAANHAIDRQAVNNALTLGFSRITWSIIPEGFDFYWQSPSYPYEPARAKQLLAEAGYPNGLDAGNLWCDAATASMAEAFGAYLQAAGIHVKIRPLERAAFFKEFQEKKLRNIVYALSSAFGNAAMRLEDFVVAGGPYVYGSYPDIDQLFREQALEVNRKQREAILFRIQRLMYDKAMFAPLWQLGFIHAQGPRVADSALGVIPGWSFSAPYENVKLKTK
ncbi:MAG TPA: ABC transporter substrate-binding protein [Candidatus Methylomirabilis sp.]|nr:ABC transporter substrate-binding protein [Candidatus Methylomirabilis sp.]